MRDVTDQYMSNNFISNYSYILKEIIFLQIRLTTVCPYMVDTGLCKVVKIRFPGFMPMVNPKNCASAIIKAQRQGIEEITIPGYLLHLNNFIR